MKQHGNPSPNSLCGRIQQLSCIGLVSEKLPFSNSGFFSSDFSKVRSQKVDEVKTTTTKLHQVISNVSFSPQSIFPSEIQLAQGSRKSGSFHVSLSHNWRIYTTSS